MNTMKTSDMTSAILRPPNTSRMKENAMTRVDGCADALYEAQAEQDDEARRERGAQGRGDVDDQADEQGAAPAEMIGQRTKDQLRAAEAQNVGGDHILPVVLVFDAKAGADLLQAGQHDVDGQGVERHQPCRQAR